MRIYQNFGALVLFLLLGPTLLFSQYSVEGTLMDSKNKYSKIVLEYVPIISSSDLNSCHAENILNSFELDSSGYFLIEGNDFMRLTNLCLALVDLNIS